MEQKPAGATVFDPLGLAVSPYTRANPAGPPPEPGNYTQVPLNNHQLVPYADLKAQGGYDRLLSLPSDIVPVLALQTLYNPSGPPNLWTDKNQPGAADVFVVGQAGGGGGGGPVAMKADGCNGGSAAGSGTWQSVTNYAAMNGSSTLYAMRISIVPDELMNDASNVFITHLFLRGVTSGKTFELGTFEFAWSAITDAAHAPIHLYYTYGPGVLLSGTFHAGEAIGLQGDKNPSSQISVLTTVYFV